MLSFERPVARALVHRQATSEVFPTDFMQTGENEFVVALQWPRRHTYFTAVLPDSSIVTETIRQITILACHLGYDVPTSQKFLMTGLGFELGGERLPTADGKAIELYARVAATDVKRTPRGELRSADFNIELRGPDDIAIAEGHGDALIASPELYSRMRGPNKNATPPWSRASPLIDARSVGRRCQEDVLLVSTGRAFEIDVDRRHPIFFDHLLDHVPGIALIEACRQVAQVQSGDQSVELRRFEGDFLRVVEFAGPATITVHRARDEAVFEVAQATGLALRASATLAFGVAA